MLGFCVVVLFCFLKKTTKSANLLLVFDKKILKVYIYIYIYILEKDPRKYGYDIKFYPSDRFQPETRGP